MIVKDDMAAPSELAEGAALTALFWLHTASLCLTTMLLAAAPRLVPWFLILIGVLSVAYLALTGAGRLVARDQRGLWIIAAVVVAYVALGALWSLNPAATLTKAGLLALMLGSAFALSTYFAALPQARAGLVARVIIVGLAIGAAILTLTLAIDQPFRHLLHDIFGAVTSGSGKDVIRKDGQIVRVMDYRLNKRFAAVALMLFMGLMLVAVVAPRRWRWAVAAALVLPLALATFASQADAAKLALVAGLITGGLVLCLPAVGEWARKGLVLLWAVAVLLAVPLGALPYKAGLQDWGWLSKQTVAARAYIWQFTTQKVRERPLTGIGARSTRELQRAGSAGATAEVGSRYRPRPGRHAHNAYLQIWLELGAIGAGLILVAGLYGLTRIGRWPDRLLPYGLATFAASAALVAVGWGLWQTWLLGLLIFVWPMAALATRAGGLQPNDAGH